MIHRHSFYNEWMNEWMSEWVSEWRDARLCFQLIHHFDRFQTLIWIRKCNANLRCGSNWLELNLGNVITGHSKPDDWLRLIPLIGIEIRWHWNSVSCRQAITDIVSNCLTNGCQFHSSRRSTQVKCWTNPGCYLSVSSHRSGLIQYKRNWNSPTNLHNPIFDDGDTSRELWLQTDEQE